MPVRGAQDKLWAHPVTARIDMGLFSHAPFRKMPGETWKVFIKPRAEIPPGKTWGWETLTLKY